MLKIGLWLCLFIFILTYYLLANSEIDRLTNMCNSILPGTEVTEALNMLSKAGNFWVARAKKNEGATPLLVGGSCGEESERLQNENSWFFTSDRYRFVFPYASCHIKEANGVIVSIHVFHD